MGKHDFLHKFQSGELEIILMVTVVDLLSKSLLLGVVWKIRVSFPPTAQLLTFNRSLNFSSRIDLAGLMQKQDVGRFPFLESSLCRILTGVSLDGEILIWSNVWASYSLNAIITRFFSNNILRLIKFILSYLINCRDIYIYISFSSRNLIKSRS